MRLPDLAVDLRSAVEEIGLILLTPETKACPVGDRAGFYFVVISVSRLVILPERE
jgi:hypothetical protein